LVRAWLIPVIHQKYEYDSGIIHLHFRFEDWEGMRHFLLRHTHTLKPTDTRSLVIFSDCVMAIAITLVRRLLQHRKLSIAGESNVASSKK